MSPRILAIAYACMPGVGSEPGTGFAWARILAGVGETWILTRPWPARQAELEAAAAAAPEHAAIHLEYVELPRWLGTTDWDPFTRGHQRLEYILWQLVALRHARRLARRHHVDLVWHLTFANVWMGSIGALVGPRFILGPVGGGVGPPWRLLAGSGRRAILGEAIRSATRTAARYLNPLARVAWMRAALILAQNRETLAWLPASARPRTAIFHHVALEERPAARQPRPSDGAPPVAMFAGRLIPWKGVALALQAIAELPGWRFIVAGSGPQEGQAARAGSSPGDRRSRGVPGLGRPGGRPPDDARGGGRDAVPRASTKRVAGPSARPSTWACRSSAWTAAALPSWVVARCPAAVRRRPCDAWLRPPARPWPSRPRTRRAPCSRTGVRPSWPSSGSAA